MALKKIMLGVSDYKSLVEMGCYFIDKSLLVEELLATPSQVVVLPRPRRFGKTLNLSMLSCFFDPREAANAELFAGLAIEGRPEAMALRGKHPVVFISLKDAKGLTWEQCLDMIRHEIWMLFGRHRYLLESEALDEDERGYLQRILDGQADQGALETSLRTLTGFLHRHYGQRAVLLIDEYDSPIQSGYGRYYESAVAFTRRLLGPALKDNPHLFRGVITGILRVAKESLFSGLNNVRAYTIMDDRFSDKFGFTGQEVARLLADHGLEDRLEGVRDWYNGYRFGRTEGIHNPWSVLCYVGEGGKTFEPHWVNTGGDGLIHEQARARGAHGFREGLMSLLAGQTVRVELELDFVFADLGRREPVFWTLLLLAGYLTPTGRAWGDLVELRVPNRELTKVFRKVALNWLEGELRVRHMLLLEAEEAMVEGRAPALERALATVMGDTFSYFDQGRSPELAYHAYVLGLMATAADRYVVRSNRESGLGRYDLMLLPRDPEGRGAVVEIKSLPPRREGEDDEAFEARVGKALDAALEQIERGRYHQELLDHGIPAERVSRCALAFAGKEPRARMGR